ncbi:MAG: protein kinase domain-containing protein, partial [Gemmatimonadaceae bacterium]
VIKVVSPELVEGLSAERFTREVKVAARLQQANIVPLLNAGDAHGLSYYTMPFVDGLSLRVRVARDGRMTLGEATHTLRDVAKALAYAHAQGVVHRDIKPENVLLSGGTAMVTDFGIAKAITVSRIRGAADHTDLSASGTLTSVGSSLGTPAYMAPEQAVGSPVDSRADLYAWGVMAYELLTGAHPFADKITPQELIAAQIAEKPQPITSKNVVLPPALAAVVMRCLEKDPARRPTSAADLLGALDNGTTPNTVPPRAAAANVPNAGRMWALGVAAALLVVAVGTWLLTRDAPAGTSRSGTAATGADKSLAVIPFVSAGADTANAYFAEGIAEELTTALSRVPGLRLAGRNSAARFRGQGASAIEVGKALNVATVLAGSLRRAGDRVRVTVELTSATDGSVLWQETYERRVEDVFAVQDQIASAIAAALQVRLGNTDGNSGVAMGTTDFDAYDLYLRGLQLYRNRRGAELREAARVLEHAIVKDPKFARPYATLASTLLMQPYYLDIRMGSNLPRARIAAEQAVALAPDLPEAITALGHVHTEAYEWEQAESKLRRAYSLAPNNSEIGFRLGFMYITSGRASLAIPMLEQVKRVDPFYSMPSMYLAWALGLTGRNSEAITEAKRALALDPANEALNNVYANTLLAAGAKDEAMTHARRLADVTTNVRRLGFYAAVIAQAGGDVSSIARRIEA